MLRKYSKYIEVSIVNLVLALVVLVPGALVTRGYVAAYAEWIFIPLAALVMFTVTSFKLEEKKTGAIAATVITLISHLILAGVKPAGFLFFLLYGVSALLGWFLGFLGRKMG